MKSIFLVILFVDKGSGSEELGDLPKVTQQRMTELGQDVCLPSSAGALFGGVGSVCGRT